MKLTGHERDFNTDPATTDDDVTARLPTSTHEGCSAYRCRGTFNVMAMWWRSFTFYESITVKGEAYDLSVFYRFSSGEQPGSSASKSEARVLKQWAKEYGIPVRGPEAYTPCWTAHRPGLRLLLDCDRGPYRGLAAGGPKTCQAGTVTDGRLASRLGSLARALCGKASS